VIDIGGNLVDYSRLTEEEMLSAIKNGLKKTSTPQKIIVVGAGMAGLTAASLLKSAGHEVHILESTHRVGGRVYTIRAPFTHGHFFEAGAMRIPESHKLVMEYINKFKLPTNEFINSNPHDILLVNGVRTANRNYEQNPDILGFLSLKQRKEKLQSN
jgi:monoamine oxidase